MKHILIYVKKFIPKQELIFTLQAGRVYEGILEDGMLGLVIDHDKIMYFTEGIIDNGNFLLETVVVTKSNYSKLSFSEKDQPKVEEYIKQTLSSVSSKRKEDKKVALQKLSDDYLAIEFADPEFAGVLREMTTYLRATYKEHYEDDIPLVDISNMIRGSVYGEGFNLGNALKYIKRYMSEGHQKSRNKDDLKKAIHYLLYQLINHE